MEFKIQSGKYISLEIIKIAMDILRESHCPYESFKTSLPDYTSFDGYTIQLDEGDEYSYYFICHAKFREDEQLEL